MITIILSGIIRAVLDKELTNKKSGEPIIKQELTIESQIKIKNEKGEYVWAPKTLYVNNWPVRKIDFIKVNTVGHILCELNDWKATSEKAFEKDESGEMTIPFKYNKRDFVAKKFVVNNSTLLAHLESRYKNWEIQSEE